MLWRSVEYMSVALLQLKVGSSQNCPSLLLTVHTEGVYCVESLRISRMQAPRTVEFIVHGS